MFIIHIDVGVKPLHSILLDIDEIIAELKVFAMDPDRYYRKSELRPDLKLVFPEFDHRSSCFNLIDRDIASSGESAPRIFI